MVPARAAFILIDQYMFSPFQFLVLPPTTGNGFFDEVEFDNEAQEASRKKYKHVVADPGKGHLAT